MKKKILLILLLFFLSNSVYWLEKVSNEQYEQLTENNQKDLLNEELFDEKYSELSSLSVDDSNFIDMIYILSEDSLIEKNRKLYDTINYQLLKNKKYKIFIDNLFDEYYNKKFSKFSKSKKILKLYNMKSKIITFLQEYEKKLSKNHKIIFLYIYVKVRYKLFLVSNWLE